MFDVLAAAFLLFTVVMVAVFFYLGFLHWREERATPLPPTGKKSGSTATAVVEAAARN